VGHGRAREAPGDRIEVVDRRPHFLQSGDGLLGNSNLDIDSLHSSAAPTRELGLDEPAEIGRNGDPLGGRCMPEGEPLLVGDGYPSDVSMTWHGCNTATRRTLVQVRNWMLRTRAFWTVELQLAPAAVEAASAGSQLGTVPGKIELHS
jgi:hypothetical protein